MALQALTTEPGAADDGPPGAEARPEVCIWHRLSEYDAKQSPPPAEWLSLRTRWPRDLPPLEDLRTVVRVRFLLDGLNEIKAPDRATQLQAVDRWTTWAAEETVRGDGLAPVFSVRTLDQSPMSTSGFEVRQIVIAPWEPAQIEAYCAAQPGEPNMLWSRIKGDPALLELSELPFNLWAQCELFRTLGRAARDRAELMGGLFWQMLARRANDAPLKVPGLLDDGTRRLLANGGWRSAPRALPDKHGCLVTWLDDVLQRLHRRGRQVSVTQYELLAGLPARTDAATPEQWLCAVRSLQLIDEGGHDEYTGEPLLRCTHQLWQEFFAARGIRYLAAIQPQELPDLAPPPLVDFQQTFARLGVAEPLPGPDPSHWEEPVKLAVQLVSDPAPWVDMLRLQNLALAGRAAVACGDRLSATTLEPLQRALLVTSRDPAIDLRLRVEAGLILGEVGDPRYEERRGRHGRYLWPRQWVRIEGGTYRLGSDSLPYSYVKPVAEVEIRPFEIAFAPVTNAEYRCFIDAGGYDDDQWWQSDLARRWRREGLRNDPDINRWRKQFDELKQDCEAWITARPGLTDAFREKVRTWARESEAEHERHLEEWYGAKRHALPQDWHDPLFNGPAQPVVGVSLYEAQAYACWLQSQSSQLVRLPREGEWEAAARGPHSRAWPWGEHPPARLQINADPAHLRRSSPIGVFPDGDSVEGLTDMAGGVWEWTTSSATAHIDTRCLTSEAPPDLSRRSVRGGSWHNTFDYCYSAYRYGYTR